MNTALDIQRTLSESRQRLYYNYGALTDELNLTMRLRQSIRRKPWSWLGGAFATGLIATFSGNRRGSSSFSTTPTTPLKTTLPSSSKKSFSVMGTLSSLSYLFLGETSLALAGVQLVRFLIPVVRPVISEYVNRNVRSKQPNQFSKESCR